MHDLKSRREIETMSNLHGRLRRLERGRCATGTLPLVVALAQGESTDQALERHMERFPGMGEWLARNPGRPLIILEDGDEQEFC